MKACYSAVGRKRRADYQVDFQDCQTLQGLRRRLFRASNALSSNIKIITGHQERYRSSTSTNIFMEDLEEHQRELQGHWGQIQTILEYSTGTARLVCRTKSAKGEEDPLTQSHCCSLKGFWSFVTMRQYGSKATTLRSYCLIRRPQASGQPSSKRRWRVTPSC